MRKLVLLLYLSALCLFATAQSKDNSIPVFFEKAYLHTDRDIYGQGEDIWFKAYVVNAQDNKPINYSHNLYVELISPGARIVKRETIRLEDGLGNGDFKLADTLKAGSYRLRAYTNWMRNFGDNFVFEKGITILNTQAAAAATANNVKIKAANANPATALSTPVPTIRFFPEGGSLVEGISSIVGVKAEDGYGKGIPAKGFIISSTGDTVSHFSCDSLGMGLLTLLPLKGQLYHAVIDLVSGLHNQVQPDESVFPLPLALSTGLSLQVKQSDTVIHAVINSSGPSTTDKINFVVKHGGKTQLNKQLQLQNQPTAIRIPTATLPEGISVITVYNSQDKPECERLVYIHHPDKGNRITITTDKKSYPSRGQVNLHIQGPPHASLSLAAVDARAVPVQPENVVSYLNLQSEIRGNIVHPDRYFDTTNVNRFKQLDQLLLTQGWRDFIWRRLEDTILKLSYEPEQGIAITGRVRRVGANKPLPGITVAMYAPKATADKLFSAKTDSAGRFAMYWLQFYGYQYIYFSARNDSKKAKGKSNSGGWLQVDSLSRDIQPIRIVNIQMPDSLPPVFLSKLNIPESHQLKEVQIKGRKFPPEIHDITLAEQKDYGNVRQYLLYTIPGAHLATSHSLGVLMLDPSAMILVYGYMNPTAIKIKAHYADGTNIDPNLVNGQDPLDLPMSDVLKITINKSINMLGTIQYSVTLKLRPGAFNMKDYFDNTVADMVGYYKAREFYQPKFGAIDDTPDTRTNTIHWEPNITTNEKGEATVNFYNSAQTGKNRIIVQGITDTGIPLVATADYLVK